MSIRFGTSKKVVATAKVEKSGGFSTYAKTPPKSVRTTNDARHTAVRGKEKSLSLKLTRRMRVPRVLDDGKQKVIATTKADKEGRYTFKVKSPDLAAVYRATTRVRDNVSNKETYPTFTLPRGVDLLKR